MPKRLGSADLAGIYGDPDRARAEAQEDLAKAERAGRELWANSARTGVFLPSLAVRFDTQRKNADFKLKRANAAVELREVNTTPILAGLDAGQLKWVIGGGLVVAAFLFFG